MRLRQDEVPASEFLERWGERETWRNLEKPKHQKRFATIARTLEPIAPHFEPPRFADIGCGFGHSTQALAKNVPGHWIGIDFAERAINEAYRHFPDGDWRLASADALSADVDAAVCSEVIEHIGDPAPFVDQVIRCARQLAVFTTPCVLWDAPSHVHLFNRNDLEELLPGGRISQDAFFWYVAVDPADWEIAAHG